MKELSDLRSKISELESLKAEQRITEEALLESEERFKDLVDKARVGIVVDDPDGNIVYYNDRFAEMFGYSPDEMLDIGLKDIAHPDDLSMIQDAHKKRMSGQEAPSHYDGRGIKKDGSILHLEVDVVPYMVGDRLKGTRTYLWDVTDRVKAQEILMDQQRSLKAKVETGRKKLKHTETLNKAVIDNSPIGITIRKRTGELVYGNPAWKRMWGLDDEEIASNEERHKGVSFLERFPFLKKFGHELNNFLSDGSPLHISEFEIEDYEHRGPQWVELYFYGIKDEAGLVDMIVSLTEDVTDRKNSEIALKQTESQIIQLFDNIAIGVYRTTPDGKVLMTNQALLDMIGYPDLDAVGSRDLEAGLFEPDYDREDFKRKMEEYGEIVGLGSYWTKKDGTKIYVRENARAIKDKSGRTLYYEGTVEDLTVENEMKARLRSETAYFEALFHSAPEAIVICSNDGVIRQVNGEFERLFKVEINNILGLDIDDVVAPGELRGEAAKYTTQTSEGTNLDVIAKRVRGDGSLIDVSIITAPILIGEDQVGVFAIYRDMSEKLNAQKEREEFFQRLETLNIELTRANTMKDEFLSNTSHELRTPLNSIMGLLKLILDGLCNDEEESREFIQIAFENSKHLLAIINDLLDLSRVESGVLEVELTEVAVRDLIVDVGALLSNQIDERGLVLNVSEVDVGLQILADKGRLRQVLNNILGNSIKFTPEGSITIDVQETDDDVMLIIIDTGVGIEPVKIDKAFEPFSQVDGSTTRKFGGTGLGLSITKKLTELMGGTIEMSSPGLGKGTTTKLSFPKVKNR